MEFTICTMCISYICYVCYFISGGHICVTMSHAQLFFVVLVLCKY